MLCKNSHTPPFGGVEALSEVDLDYFPILGSNVANYEFKKTHKRRFSVVDARHAAIAGAALYCALS